MGVAYVAKCPASSCYTLHTPSSRSNGKSSLLPPSPFPPLSLLSANFEFPGNSHHIYQPRHAALEKPVEFPDKYTESTPYGTYFKSNYARLTRSGIFLNTKATALCSRPTRLNLCHSTSVKNMLAPAISAVELRKTAHTLFVFVYIA
jgi:hypothetical protein